MEKGKLEKFKIFGKDYPTLDDTGVPNYIQIIDLAEGQVAALKKRVRVCRYPSEAGKGTSVIRLLKASEEATGIIVPYEITARKLADIAENFADVPKAEKLLRWIAKRDLFGHVQERL